VPGIFKVLKYWATVYKTSSSQFESFGVKLLNIIGGLFKNSQDFLAILPRIVFILNLTFYVDQVALKIDLQIYKVFVLALFLFQGFVPGTQSKGPSIPTIIAAVSNPYLRQLSFKYLKGFFMVCLCLMQRETNRKRHMFKFLYSGNPSSIHFWSMSMLHSVSCTLVGIFA